MPYALWNMKILLINKFSKAKQNHVLIIHYSYSLDEWKMHPISLLISIQINKIVNGGLNKWTIKIIISLSIYR